MNKNYQPKNVLITGGAGFIGANFIRHLLTHYPAINVVNLDLLTYAASLNNLENLPNTEHYHFFHGNITERALIDKILRQHQIDTIIHFAAESHVDRSIEGPSIFIHTNVVGTSILLEAARQYWLQEQQWSAQQCRFHHISTDEVYGALGPNDPPFTEATAYAPNSPYSASKASSDHLVRAYFHTYKLPMTITNCSNNYGPYQHAEKFIPVIIQHCLQQKPIPIYGDGSQIRDWLFVEDHCEAIMAIIQKGQLGKSYNIGGNNEWSNLKLVQLICELMDELNLHGKPHNKLINFVNDRPGHDWRYAININKITRELGWQPKTTFIEGLRKTIAFYLES